MTRENLNNASEPVSTSGHQIDSKKKRGYRPEKLHKERREDIKATDVAKPDETQGLQVVSTNEFHFLPDDPVEVDEFGTHERVAESIGQMVESKTKGKTIGLEGTWGSGKSSVIKMLEDRWSKGEYKNENIRLFTYDAWEHQGDPLRRAFLEELITNLQEDEIDNKRWLKECKIEEHEFEHCLDECSKKDRLNCPDFIRDNLRLRYEHNVIKTEPTISGKGIAFGILTLLMPICLSFVLIIPKWWNIIPGILASVPVLFILIYLLWLKFIERKDCKEILGEFFGKSKETTKHTTQRAPEPTTIEFQEYYEKILSLVLEDKKRKLVIVVDNLDRVVAETALKVWGTMRTFLEKTNYKDKDMISRIWVVVPYDVEAIEKLWLNAKKEPDKELALAFKEKTFQVRYRVAPPLASRWEIYFKKQLSKAFPNQEQDTYHSIYNIFRIQALPRYDRQLPTPREQKLFINRMVALAQQHFPDVSLEEIALYAGSELSEPAMLDNLVGWQPEYEEHFVDFVGEDWRCGLAAIHFGVSRKDADEVLYEPVIRKCLAAGDSSGLLESVLENPGGPQCCERYLLNFAPDMPTAELLKASAAFAAYSPQNAGWHIRRSIKILGKRIETSDSNDWKFGGVLREGNADDVIRLMDFSREVCDSVRDNLSIRINGEEYAKLADPDKAMGVWVKAAVKIVRRVRSRVGFDSTLRLEMPDGETYLKVLDLVISEPGGKDIIQFFCPADSVSKAYSEEYLAKIQQGEIRATDIDIIQGFLKMPCYDTNIAESVASSLQTAMTPSLSYDRAVYTFRIFYTQRNNSVFAQKLKDIAVNGRAFELLKQHHGQPECAAFCIGTILLYHPTPEFDSGHAAYNGQQKYHELLENPDENIAQNIGKYCIEFDWLEDINRSVHDTDAAESNCMAVILRKLVNQDNNNDYLTTDRFISCHSVIKSNLDNDEEDEVNPYETLVGRLLKKKDGNLLSALQDREMDIEFGHAYYIALNDEESDTSSLANKLCQELREKLGKDEWLKQLKDEDWMLYVVIKLVEQEFKPNLDNKFVDALIEHARLVLGGKAKVESLQKSWTKLLDGLSDVEREQFRRQLPNVLLDVQKPILLLTDLYKDELEIAIQNADKPIKKRFVSNTCMQIADRREPDELRWMITLFNKEKSLIKSAVKTDKEGLRNRLDEFLKKEYAKFQEADAKDSKTDESDSDDLEWLSAVEDVAKQLGVKLKPEDEKKDANQKDSKIKEDK